MRKKELRPKKHAKLKREMNSTKWERLGLELKEMPTVQIDEIRRQGIMLIGRVSG
jgi:hypothetical protein